MDPSGNQEVALSMKLVIVSTVKIQEYIFGSNRLRENIGGSYLVDAVTGDWAFEQLDGKKTNARKQAGRWMLDDSERIETGRLDAEVLYAGGGNFTALFVYDADARTFTRELSRKILEDAPGLRFVIAHRDFIWETQALGDAVPALLEQVEREKLARSDVSPLLGQGVTMACQSTGLPAREYVEEAPKTGVWYPASGEIAAKMNAAENDANTRLNREIPIPASVADFVYPFDFDKLGRSEGSESYLAVVHADGDGMGQRLIELCDQLTDSGDGNRVYIMTVRDFSRKLEDAASKALKDALAELVDSFEFFELDNGRHVLGLRHLNDERKLVTAPLLPIRLENSDAYFLPFRPLVYGGDDLTVVCDGRIGIAFAIAYLEAFERHAKNIPAVVGDEIVPRPGTSSAGVSIVKVHYPFARAYRLSEGLAKSAKELRRTLKEKREVEPSCLDWHFALSGLFGAISEIRKREYEPRGDKLYLRPVTLHDNEYLPACAWPVVDEAIAVFQGAVEGHFGKGTEEARRHAEQKWAQRRNKAKALRDALRAGEESVRAFTVQFNNGRNLPVFDIMEQGKHMPTWPETGWGWVADDTTRCGYFDALEAADWYIPFKSQKEGNDAS